MDYIDEVCRDWTRLRPGLDMSAYALALRLVRAGRLIDGELHAVAKSSGLAARGDGELLTALLRSPRGVVQPIELARWTQISTAGTTSRLDRLEGLGLIARTSNADDRRSILVSLTEAGAQEANVLLDRTNSTSVDVLGHLTDEQRSRLSDALRELLVALDDTSRAARGEGGIDERGPAAQ